MLFEISVSKKKKSFKKFVRSKKPDSLGFIDTFGTKGYIVPLKK